MFKVCHGVFKVCNDRCLVLLCLGLSGTNKKTYLLTYLMIDLGLYLVNYTDGIFVRKDC